MYLVILLLLFAANWLGTRSLKRTLYWLVLLGLFLFSAFRFRVGCDWEGYYQNYLSGFSLDFNDAYLVREPAWALTQVAFTRLGIPYPWVNVLTSALFFVGVDALARRQPDRFAFLVLLFPVLIINMPMSGVRQGAAIGLFCFAIIAFMDRRPLRFLIWTLLASTIHASAMAFVLMAPLALGRLTRGRIALTLCMAVPALIYLTQRDEFQLAVDRYVDTGLEAYGAAFRVGILTLTGVYFLLMIRKTWSGQFPKDYPIVNLGSWLMVLLAFAVPVSTVIADRFGYYLIPLQTMILSRIGYLNLGPSRKFQAALPYLGLLFLFSVWSLQSSHFAGCYNPYQSWLFGYPEGIARLPYE